MSTGGYTTLRDYGDHHRQHAEYMELVGLLDPADRFDSPAGPPIPSSAFVPAISYPIDGR